MPNKKPVKTARGASKPKASARVKRAAPSTTLPTDSMWITGLAMAFTALCIVFAVVAYWQYGR